MRMLVPAKQFEFLSSVVSVDATTGGGKNPQVSDNLRAISIFHCYLENIRIRTRIYVLDFQMHLKCTLKYKRRNTFIRNYCF